MRTHTGAVQKRLAICGSSALFPLIRVMLSKGMKFWFMLLIISGFFGNAVMLQEIDKDVFFELWTYAEVSGCRIVKGPRFQGKTNISENAHAELVKALLFSENDNRTIKL
jgi:hypothetical protein